MLSLGERMKKYESASKFLLPLNSYVIIRIDGRSFGTYCKGFNKPFDDTLIACMDITALKLCEEIQNVVMGYWQSDEISLLLYDGDVNEKQPFFDNEVQKICSIGASIATAEFNQRMNRLRIHNNPNLTHKEIMDILNKKQANFDARCFIVPNIPESINYFYWRQRDCIVNSISMVGQAKFSHKELHKKNTSDVKQMLLDKGICWEGDFDGRRKQGGFWSKNSGYKHAPTIICDPQNEVYKLIPNHS